ncbi:gephyrin-like molybdotransferase receptor GlpR [Streptomyces sp. NPDC049954]|uniref:gephyrin-like molybdotransferase receptor GlpR n=1 Tax=Streptomyces sp. NPDC049954 TaxID=3155779 RepID=UPI003424BA4C
MSSSGLIYAVIVGAWAAYLVPMWLRRQDELNEARPTERFSTAIRLLSGRAGMERRYAKGLQERSEEEPGDAPELTDSVDVRSFAVSRTTTTARPPSAGPEAHGPQGRPPSPPAADRQQAAPSAAHVRHEVRHEPARDAREKQETPEGPGEERARAVERRPRATESEEETPESLARARRSKVLARRRRTTALLFLLFTLGAVAAAVFGLAFLWAPAAPALMLSAYIVYLRGQERHRFAYTMDRRRAEAAAQRLREQGSRRRPPQAGRSRRDHHAADEPTQEYRGLEEDADTGEHEPQHRGATARDRAAQAHDAAVTEPVTPGEDPQMSALAAGRRALVEQTDHAEWVDQQRERQRHPRGAGWDPVPVPLPTYVTAPVAPRATQDVDLGAPDVWSSARSGTADPGRTDAPDATDPERTDQEPPSQRPRPDGQEAPASRKGPHRRPKGRTRTPLFDQYEEGDHPRAANE